MDLGEEWGGAEREREVIKPQIDGSPDTRAIEDPQ
jgi:hypothetical protein